MTFIYHLSLLISVPYSQDMQLLTSWPVGEDTRFEGICSFAVDSSTDVGVEMFNISFSEPVFDLMVRLSFQLFARWVMARPQLSGVPQCLVLD